MNLPFVLRKNVPTGMVDTWNAYFFNQPDRDWTRVEGIWRRTQNPENRENSGWRSSTDTRRKLLHFDDKYGMSSQAGSYDFQLVNPYLWVALTFPRKEMASFLQQINCGLEEGMWSDKERFSNDAVTRVEYSRGDLAFRLLIYNEMHPQDVKEQRSFPPDYQTIECLVTGKSPHLRKAEIRQPWDVLKTGIRKKDIRENSRIVSDMRDIAPFLPAQVEVGCGPSIECGISPLHVLHGIYQITDIRDGSFILSPERDSLLYNVLSCPERFFMKSGQIFQEILSAKPGVFHTGLKKLHDHNYCVGPVITNNFDRLCFRSGLEETYVRRYEESSFFPNIQFDPRARSYLVFGCHADRRRIQRSARNSGLQLIFVDPEGYDNGIQYPLEQPTDSDIVINTKSSEAMSGLLTCLGLS